MEKEIRSGTLKQWQYYNGDGCRFDAHESLGRLPFWCLSNFDLHAVELRCSSPLALADDEATADSQERRLLAGPTNDGMPEGLGFVISLCMYEMKKASKLQHWPKLLKKGEPQLYQYVQPAREMSAANMTVRGMEDLTSRFDQYEVRPAGPVLICGKSKLSPESTEGQVAVDGENAAFDTPEDAKVTAKRESDYHEAVKKWKRLSQNRDWDQVIADLEVYAFSGKR